MRVTNQMIMDRTIFNLSRNMARFMNMQGMMSTGRRINTPSDDPMGTQHDLNYRTRLAEITQYLSNISQADGRLSFYEDTLSDLKDLYESANETAITMGNDTFTEVEREAAANEIESIYQQVVQLINKQINGRYIFSGHRIRTQPLNAGSRGVIYQGDTGILESEMDSGSRVQTNLIGQDIFFQPLLTLGEGVDLSPGLTAGTLVADLNLGRGVELSPGTFEIYDANRDLTYALDISAAVTLGDIITTVNAALGPGGNLALGIADNGSSLVWRPVMGTQNTISDQTPLSNLNAGLGLNLSGGTMRIRTSDNSIVVDIDLSGTSTIGEVRAAISNALISAGVANVTVGYNLDGTGLSIADANPVPLDLVVEDLNGQPATGLGLVGAVGAYLDGSDLRPAPDFIIRDIGAQTTAADLGYVGRLTQNKVSNGIRPRLSMTTPLAALNNNAGFPLGEIEISQGNRTVTVDLGNSSLVTIADLIARIDAAGLDIEASLNAAGTGIQIVSTVADRTLTIKSGDGTMTARVLGIEGSPDMLGALLLLCEALHNNDGAMARKLIGNMDLAMQELLRARATVGARMLRLDTTLSRLESTQISVTKMLSEVEDADMISVVSGLAREENLYQAALAASAKVIQPSLIDFLD